MKISCPWLGDFIDLDVLGTDTGKVGEALTSVGLKLEEVEESGDASVLDIEVTTNRPDCLNHLGIARELATQFRLRLRPPDCSLPSEDAVRETLPSSVTIENSDLCPRYSARVLTRVSIEESPGWLKARLEAVGQRPINNIVDITNYVMLELGQPLHAFDYEKLEENRIVVRTANQGEDLVTLDGVKRDLDSSMLVICDATRPVALAGIMGGEETEVSQQTKTVLLESAYFDPGSVRSTAKRLGLRTEASFRFERGADSEMPVKALNRACHLIMEIAGGVCAGPVMDEYPNPQANRVIQLRSERIRKVAGVSIEHEFAVDTLQRLGFEISEVQKGVWKAEVPSFRVDVGIEDDLVEEVTRHYGYDRIEPVYPPAFEMGTFLPTDEYERIITRTLAGLGFLEAINYVFTTPSKEAVFWNASQPMIAISNPLTEVGTHLRISLLPGLIESLRHNLHHGVKDVRLFEFGKVFVPGESGDSEDFEEISRLAILATGTFYRPFWDTFQDPFQFHHLKGVVQVLLESLNRQVRFETAPEVAFLHPRVAAQVSTKAKPLGFLGQLHPRIQESCKFLEPVLLAELSLDPLFAQALAEPRHEALGRFPSVERDLSFVVDKKVEYGKILSVLKELDLPDLQDIQLVDLYKGPSLPKGRVSLSIRLTFANSTRTLNQEEVNRYTERVLSVLASTFSAQVRS